MSPLLTMSRSRCVPASGANVSADFLPLDTMFAMSSSNLSTLWLGSDRFTFSPRRRFLICTADLSVRATWIYQTEQPCRDLPRSCADDHNFPPTAP